ncbi:MAG: hypothetical protein SFY68_01095 [Candidatus Sumerlaeia bacterium]|nr:hypothetical protein [Candidatus Sumerlaeia bacterium]
MNKFCARMLMSGVGVLFTGCFLLTGCQHSGDYDLPHGYIPKPAGTSSGVIFNMQASKGEQNNFVLTSNRFIADRITLSPKGQKQVDWMVRNIDQNAYKVIVEPTGDSSLDEARRKALVDYFTLQGIEDAENIIVLSTVPFDFIPAESVDSM